MVAVFVETRTDVYDYVCFGCNFIVRLFTTSVFRFNKTLFQTPVYLKASGQAFLHCQCLELSGALTQQGAKLRSATHITLHIVSLLNISTHIIVWRTSLHIIFNATKRVMP